MSHKNPQKNSPFFRTAWSGKLLQIIAVSVVFHLLIVAAVIGLNQIHFERPPEAVKVFQLVQVQSPKPVKPAAPRPKPQPPKPEPPNRTEKGTAETQAGNQEGTSSGTENRRRKTEARRAAS